VFQVFQLFHAHATYGRFVVTGEEKKVKVWGVEIIGGTSGSSGSIPQPRAEKSESERNGHSSDSMKFGSQDGQETHQTHQTHQPVSNAGKILDWFANPTHDWTQDQ
jgi:hypothetical protein